MIIGVSGKLGSGKDTIGYIIKALTIPEWGAYSTLGIAAHILEGDNVDIKKDSKLTFDELISKYGTRFIYIAASQSDWKVRKYAYKLKQIASMLTGITMGDLEKEEVKSRDLGPEWDRYVQYRTHRIVSADSPAPHMSKERMTVRMLLQEIGTDAMREVIHPNIWVNALFADYVQKSTFELDKIGNWDGSKPDQYPNWIITDVRFPNEADAIFDKGGIVIRVNRPKNDTCCSCGNPRSDHNYRHLFMEKTEHVSETALDSYSKFTEVIENNGTIEELVPKIKVVLQKHKLIS